MFEQLSFIFPKYLWNKKINNTYLQKRKTKQNKTYYEGFSLKLQFKNQKSFQ